jgi:hypothetical protein
MTGSLDQFVLIKASKSLGGVWSDDDYIVRDRARNVVVGRIMLHPASNERPAVVLDDNGAWNPTISWQSRLRSDTWTADGGFQGALVGEYQLTLSAFRSLLLPESGSAASAAFMQAFANVSPSWQTCAEELGRAASCTGGSVRRWNTSGCHRCPMVAPTLWEPNPIKERARQSETWPKATAFFWGIGGRGLDGVWPGFSVAAFKKDKRL